MRARVSKLGRQVARYPIQPGPKLSLDNLEQIAELLRKTLADSASLHALPSASRPILVSVPEAKRQFGGIGSTMFYGIVKRYGIKLVKLGGRRSLVPMAEIERVIAELMSAERSPLPEQNARDLASNSVAARRRRRGSE
jgi:hypothetical protein